MNQYCGVCGKPAPESGICCVVAQGEWNFKVGNPMVPAEREALIAEINRLRSQLATCRCPDESHHTQK